jgi:hypothetical protein
MVFLSLTGVSRPAHKGTVTSNEAGMTNVERARRFKSRMVAAGLVQVNIWVPAAAVADVQRAAELMRAHPHLTVARLADRQTGKLTGLKRDTPIRNRATGTATE